MKPDKLEKFISENREQFDDELPSPEIWGKISADIKPKSSLAWKSITWKAAAVVIIFAASWYLHDLIDRSQTNQQIHITEELDPGDKQELQAFMEARAYYSSKIGSTQKQVHKLAGNNRQLIKDLNQEFDELDQIMRELQKDLQDNAATEEVVEAMIQNYRIKLLILEEVLQQLKENQTEENNGDDEYKI